MAHMQREKPSLYRQLVKESENFMLSNDIYWLKYYQGDSSNSVKDWEENVLQIPSLHRVAFDGNLTKFVYLLSQGGNVNERILDGPKLLRTQSKYYVEHIGFFRGTTPLMVASQAGNKKIVKYLLDHGASVKMSDSVGITAFTWACVSNHIDVCKLLLSHGAKLNTKDNCFDMTPFLLTCQSNHLKVVKWLVRNGTDINARTPEGRTALHLASVNKNSKLIRYLIRKGLDVNALDSSGNSPLHTLNHSLDSNDTDNAWTDKEEGQLRNIFKMLSKFENVTVDINRETQTCGSLTTPPSSGWYALKALIELGANLNLKNDEGQTALHTLILNLPEAVCSHGYVITNSPVQNQYMLAQMLILLTAGADPSIVDSNGKTALDYCHDVGNTVAFKILDRYADDQKIEIENWDLLKDNVEAYGLRFSEKVEDFEKHIQEISNIILTREATGWRALIPSRQQCQKLLTEIADWIEVNWNLREF